MRWITALHLQHWADTLSSRDVFPLLIADLIRASAGSIREIRFPNGNKGQVRGFDGVLEATGNLPYVPEGKSIWEFGVSADSASKAGSDYEKRTNQVDEAIRKDTTFVFASPRTWNHPKQKLADWIKDKNARGEWKNVVYLDGSQLEDWLAKCPAVASRYARVELKLIPVTGARSIDEFWAEYSSRFDPPLVEDVILSGRDQQANELVERLSEAAAKLSYAADSAEEVVAFVVAAIRRAETGLSQFLAAKTLVVDTEEAARQLTGPYDLIYLPRGQARNFAGLLAQRGPTVVSAGGDEKRNRHELLNRPKTSELATALALMGFSETESYSVARRCGRSLTILARQHPSGTASNPKWLESGETLLPALLAGAWHVPTTADQDVLCALAAARSYDEFETPLRRLAKMEDPPLDQVGDIWTMRSSVDAFVNLGHLIGGEHLKRFAEMAKVVFSKVSELPKPDDIYKPFSEKRSDLNSEWLRDGMMNTLLHMAVLHEQADFKVLGSTPQNFVNDIVRSLPGLSSDHRLLVSLEGQMTLLAEAAPIPFLEALEQLLKGDASGIRPIFEEHTVFVSPHSFHCGVLWGLEVVAWDPTLLLRASMCLARLAEIDPGGTLSNRPINSLREILLSWSPKTHATMAQRIGVLKCIINEVPAIGWTLLTKLLPSYRDISHHTQTPRFRAYDEQEILTYGLVWQNQAAIIQMSIELAGTQIDRWMTLIGSMRHFEKQAFESFVKALEAAVDCFDSEGRLLVWDVLHKEVIKHRAYANAEWSLSPESLNLLLPLIDALTPQSVEARVVWLFDEWMPNVEPEEDTFEARTKAVDLARKKALSEIFSESGVEGLVRLIQKAKQPYQVVAGIGQLELPFEVLSDLFSLSLKSLPEQDEIVGKLFIDGKLRFGEKWMNFVKTALKGAPLLRERLVRILSFLEDNESSWTYIEDYGAGVVKSFWQLRYPFSVRGNVTELITAVNKYIEVGRCLAAFSAIGDRISEIPTALIVQLLDQSIQEINSGKEVEKNLSFYAIERAFEELRNRQDISEDELASLEFRYLPILLDRQKPLTLHSLLLKSPKLFMDIICAVFAPASGTIEVSEESKRIASASYDLLTSLDIIPGLHGNEVDKDALLKWCIEVREIAVQVDRQVVTEQRIGCLLAHSPASSNDKAWPHEAVRSVIDELASHDLDRGIIMERFNMRGVFSKSIGEGGKQERQLAHQNREWAAAMPNYPRTSALLTAISDGWLIEAEREDVLAEKQEIRW